MNPELSRRIAITRYLMVIGIIFLHLPPYIPLSAMDGSFFSFIKAFFTHGLFRTTVPVLTAISGYLLFYNNLHLHPVKLLRKKGQNLFIPLILWNLPLAIAVYLMQKYSMISFDFSSKLYPFEIKNAINALTGFKGTPINYPLNFLRDLFMISLLSPLYWQLLKRIPYTGFLVVFTVYFFNLDGPWVLRNSMLVSFYIGALAAHKQWDLKRLDAYAPYLLTLLVSACIILVIYRIPNREPLRLIAPFLVWPSIHLILNTRFADLLHRHAKNSFVTYLSHGPVILVAWLAFNRLPGQIPYVLYWAVAPIIAVLAAVVIRALLNRIFPKLASIALGGRG